MPVEFTLLAGFVSCVNMINASVTANLILYLPSPANALIGFAIPVTVDALAPIIPSITVAGTLADTKPLTGALYP